MKHLKKFNEELSSEEDIKRNLEDILIDFSDRHIPVIVRNTISDGFVKKNICSIALGDEHSDITEISIIPKDNEDDFLRVFDYMESEGYQFSSMSYEFSGSAIVLRAVDIEKTFGSGMDAISNQLFNGIDETCYLKLFFRKR